MTLASSFCAVAGSWMRWIAVFDPSTAVAAPSSACVSPSRASAVTARIASATPPLSATEAVASRPRETLRYVERTSAALTLSLPMSIPNQVGICRLSPRDHSIE
jgi:hypothetical protein